MKADRLEYQKIFRHYESTLEKYGPNARGMDWPNEDDVIKRFQVMSELGLDDKNQRNTLLDLGCGIGLFSDFLEKNYPNKYTYSGVDISSKMIKAGQKNYPHISFDCRDILRTPFEENQFDFVVMNGVLTEKVSLTKKNMVAFAEAIVKEAFKTAKIGLAFNTMSSHVDWEREDLFHWPLDEVVGFLVKECSRNIQVRMDYGLYEYTIYVYKQPTI